MKLGSVKLRDDELFFDNLIWLTVESTAIYLQKYKRDGRPSVGAVYNLLERNRRKLKVKKSNLDGRVYIHRPTLDDSIEASPDW